MKMINKKYYAFFDVDGTITDKKTMLDFLEFYYCKRFAKTIGKLMYGLYIFKSKYHLLCGKKREFLNAKYYQCYKNQDVKWIKKLGDCWFHEKFDHLDSYKKTVINELANHQSKGGEIVFVSGSFYPCLNPIAQRLGVKHILGASLQIDKNRYTGKLILPQTIGIGKAESIQNFLRKNNYSDYENCYAYGDHSSDIPMLSLVGHPNVVSGDLLMEKYAEKRGWRII